MNTKPLKPTNHALPAKLDKRRVRLATADGVALWIDRPIKIIYDRADGADNEGFGYQWVWNVATNPHGKIRNLRFWVAEIENPQATAKLSLEEVIAEILPAARREYPAGTVCQFMQMRPITLSMLRGELAGEVRQNCGFYPRAGLEKFFRTRWLGAAAPGKPT